MRYELYDSYGCLVRKFPTYLAALHFKETFGNIGWTINH